MEFNFRINIPKPKPIRMPVIKLPPPLKVPPIKELAKKIPNLSKPLTIPQIELPIKIDIVLPGLPPLHIDTPVINIPPLKIPPIPPIPKPEIDMPALKQALGIIAGVISMHPIGKGIVMGVTGIADAASGGKASDFINNGNKVNGTLAMLPAGLLAQQIANDATKGKSGNTLSRSVPDPKKMVMDTAINVGKQSITNPSNTLSALKDAGKSNIQIIKSNETIKLINKEIVKPTVATVVKPIIASIIQPTIATVVKPTLQALQPTIGNVKPSIVSILKEPIKAVDKVKSTLSNTVSAVIPVRKLPPPTPLVAETKSTLQKITPVKKKDDGDDDDDDGDYILPISLGLAGLALILLL